MISRHKQLEIGDALPGMVLSGDVADARGTVLLPNGSTLTESTIRSLERRGIDFIQILDTRISSAELEAERKRRQLRLAHLFRKHPAKQTEETALRALAAGGQDGDLLLRSVAKYRLGEFL